jgi:iron complex outermembrane receptor protein
MLIRGVMTRYGWTAFALSLLCIESAFAQLEEIVVIAQKREQSIQDVPLSITAFSGEDIDRLGIQTSTQLTAQVPGLQFHTVFSEANNPTFFLRGIGLLDFGDIAETPVGFYVDEAYLGTQASQALQLYDIERVEVLKGPQGTLYGRNTTGGLLHFISRRPTEELEGYLNFQYGRFDQKILDGAVSGALTPWLRGRVAVKANYDDGWQESRTSGADDFNSTGYHAGRVQLEVDLGEHGNFLFNAHLTQSEQKSPLYPYFGHWTDTTATVACTQEVARTGACFTSEGNRYDLDPRKGETEVEKLISDIDSHGFIGTLTLELGAVQVTSITSYEEVSKLYQEDADAQSFPFANADYRLKSDQITEELRFSGRIYDRVDWIAGLYYFDEDRETSTDLPVIAGFIGLPMLGTLGDQTSSSIAGFGQVEIDVVDWLSLNGGVRYTSDEKDVVLETPFILPPTPGSINVDRATFKVGASARPVEDLLAYFNFSTGFKTGGFNANFIFDPAETQPVQEELIDAYEIGIKWDLWDQRARLNAAAFYYDYTDIQGVVFDASAGIVGTSRLKSVGDAEIKGFELEMSLQPHERLELLFGLGVLDTEIDSTEVFEISYGGAGGFFSVDGNDLPMAPDVSLNGVARYFIPLRSNGELMLQVDFSWRDDVNFSAGGNQEAMERGDSFGLADVKLAWQSADDRYSAEVFVENVFDEEYLLYRAIVEAGNSIGAWGRPRWWGIRVGASF